MPTDPHTNVYGSVPLPAYITDPKKREEQLPPVQSFPQYVRMPPQPRTAANLISERADQPIAPATGVPLTERQVQPGFVGFKRAMGELTEGMIDPKTVSMIAAATLFPVGVVSLLLKAGFTAMGIHTLANTMPAAKEAFQRGDTEEGVRQLTNVIAYTGMVVPGATVTEGEFAAVGDLAGRLSDVPGKLYRGDYLTPRPSPRATGEEGWVRVFFLDKNRKIIGHKDIQGLRPIETSDPKKIPLYGLVPGTEYVHAEQMSPPAGAPKFERGMYSRVLSSSVPARVLRDPTRFTFSTRVGPMPEGRLSRDVTPGEFSAGLPIGKLPGTPVKIQQRRPSGRILDTKVTNPALRPADEREWLAMRAADTRAANITPVRESYPLGGEVETTASAPTPAAPATPAPAPTPAAPAPSTATPAAPMRMSERLAFYERMYPGLTDEQYLMMDKQLREFSQGTFTTPTPTPAVTPTKPVVPQPAPAPKPAPASAAAQAAEVPTGPVAVPPREVPKTTTTKPTERWALIGENKKPVKVGSKQDLIDRVRMKKPGEEWGEWIAVKRSPESKNIIGHVYDYNERTGNFIMLPKDYKGEIFDAEGNLLIPEINLDHVLEGGGTAGSMVTDVAGGEASVAAPVNKPKNIHAILRGSWPTQTVGGAARTPAEGGGRVIVLADVVKSKPEVDLWLMRLEAQAKAGDKIAPILINKVKQNINRDGSVTLYRVKPEEDFNFTQTRSTPETFGNRTEDIMIHELDLKAAQGKRAAIESEIEKLEAIVEQKRNNWETIADITPELDRLEALYTELRGVQEPPRVSPGRGPESNVRVGDALELQDAARALAEEQNLDVPKSLKEYKPVDTYTVFFDDLSAEVTKPAISTASQTPLVALRGPRAAAEYPKRPQAARHPVGHYRPDLEREAAASVKSMSEATTQPGEPPGITEQITGVDREWIPTHTETGPLGKKRTVKNWKQPRAKYTARWLPEQSTGLFEIALKKQPQTPLDQPTEFLTPDQIVRGARSYRQAAADAEATAVELARRHEPQAAETQFRMAMNYRGRADALEAGMGQAGQIPPAPKPPSQPPMRFPEPLGSIGAGTDVFQMFTDLARQSQQPPGIPPGLGEISRRTLPPQSTERIPFTAAPPTQRMQLESKLADIVNRMRQLHPDTLPYKRLAAKAESIRTSLSRASYTLPPPK